MQAKLIVTIDTEEEGLWSGKFSGYDNPVENLAGVPRFQAICDRYGVKPTYLVDSPVVTDPAASAVLEPIAADERCEIGCHIHPWNTPPEEDDISSERSYLCNLPTDLQRKKLTTITAQIESRYGRRPTSFRAGRYGMGDAGVTILKELGYIVDSSVCPYMDYSEDGGPDFRSATWRPYFLDQKLLEPADQLTDLLEVPVSFGFNWTNFDNAHRLDEFLSGPAIRRFRVKGILERAGILRKIKFSPEKADTARLTELANAYARQNAPCLVMMFHSSSLKAGYSPYVSSEADLDRFLTTIDETLKYCLEGLNMQGATLSEFAAEFIAASVPIDVSG